MGFFGQAGGRDGSGKTTHFLRGLTPVQALPMACVIALAIGLAFRSKGNPLGEQCWQGMYVVQIRDRRIHAETSR